MLTGTTKHLMVDALTMAVLLMPSTKAKGQASASPIPPRTSAATLPVSIQIKKTVVFIATSCLHDFSMEVGSLTKERFLQLPSPQALTITKRLIEITSRLANVQASLRKLSPEDLAYLKKNISLNEADVNQVAEEGAWRATILLKMSALGSDDIAHLTLQEMSLIPTDDHLGTAFFVGVPNNQPETQDQMMHGFSYLVTNRHNAQPGTENGAPCRVLGATLLLNHKPDKDHSNVFTEKQYIDPKFFHWVTPDDESVDLAAMGLAVSPEQYDFVVIPTTSFVTDEEITSRKVVEGDPVIFSGLFIQSFQEVHTLEPIVRSGTLAMIPQGKLQTTMNYRMGNIYLADAHVFGGNSGSPVFVDTTRFADYLAKPQYKFLGVICGEMFENSDLTFNVTTTLTANSAANSGVSMVVPAREVLALLNKAEFKLPRDEFNRSHPIPVKGSQEP